MATSLASPGKQPGLEAAVQKRIDGIKFDRLMVVMTSWLIGGLYLDGWAHSHIPQLETFFTPWHAALYSGFFACAMTIVGIVAINHTRGYAWRQAIPSGYELSLLGAPLFLIGGVADMFWHILFGIERNTEALLSPTHLLLAFSGVLILSGPFRAAWRRSDTETGWVALLPMLLSLLATYSLFTFFTEFAHPFAHTSLVTDGFSNMQKSYGVAGILLQTGILMGFILLAIKRWWLPFGALTLVLTLNAAMVGVFAYQYELIPSAFVAGLVADLLITFLKPSVKRHDSLRLFAFVVPTVLYLGYFLTLMMLSGMTWTIHLWLGSCILAGLVGLLLSYLLVPPQGPGEGKQKTQE